jgi:glycosyltransferase involved in cell wall biosynthesis
MDHSENMLEHLVEKRAPNRIHFRGFSDQPYDVLASADLFVSASRIEGFGNAIWEALVLIGNFAAGQYINRNLRYSNYDLQLYAMPGSEKRLESYAELTGRVRSCRSTMRVSMPTQVRE